MALSVIIALYIGMGLMAAAGSVAIAKTVLSPTAEQLIFGLVLVPIAGFYGAFTAYVGHAGAWRLEAGAVAVCAVLGVLGSRVPVVVLLGYGLHGLWDLRHALQAHAGLDFATRTVTAMPLAYGAFCATYDGCLAAYFSSRRRQWRVAWGAPAR